MKEVCFVFASTSERSPKNVIDKYLNNVEYDIKFLSSQAKDKILKKDVDLNLKELEPYKIVAIMGADALKYTIGMTGVQKYNGMFIENKYLPIMNPSIILIKPQLEEDIKRAFAQIPKLLGGANTGVANEKDYCFIETEDQFQKYKPQIEEASVIVADIETTSVSAYTGSILGVAISTRAHQGLYITDALVQKHKNWFHKQFSTKKVIFHNAKFDIGFMQYHYNFEFPDYEDTMLLHYSLEEAVGTHGLKSLAMRFTDLGDYERELDDYKKTWARQNKIKLEDFNYGMLPTEVLAPYACLTKDSYVIMADGSKKTIGDLVRTNSRELVRSFNHRTNTWENKPICGWYSIRDKQVTWYKIATSITSKNSRWETYNGPAFTPDHRIATNNGYMEVQNIDITKDRIAVDDYELTKDQQQVLLGSLMGDGTLTSRNGLGAGFVFSQVDTRKDYFDLKVNLFKRYVNNIIYSKDRGLYSMYTKYTEQFSDINNNTIWRPTSQDKKPYLSTEFLSKLDWLAIAIWYFDDGNNAENARHNMGKRIRIWSRTVSAEEQQNVITVLRNTFGIKAEYFNDGNNQFFVIKNYDVFFSNIAKYATKDLTYKIPKKYHDLINTYKYSTEQVDPYFAEIKKIVEWTPPTSRRGYKTKWCIDVEDNHNFLTDVGLVHNCKDADATMQLYNKFKPIVDKSFEFTKLYKEILIPATYALRKLEKNGGPVDKDEVEFVAKQYQIDVEECLAEISTSENVSRFERIHQKIFNPNSTAQLRELLFNIMGLKPTKKTETGAWSVDKEVLQEIGHPLTEAILDLREKSKMAGTYISNIRDGIDLDGRLRSGFNIHGTTSGRLSSSGTLNYQNIPRDNKDIKKLFRARPGYKIVQCD